MIIPKVNLKGFLSSENSINDSMENNPKSGKKKEVVHSEKSPKVVYNKSENLDKLWVELLKYLFDPQKKETIINTPTSPKKKIASAIPFRSNSSSSHKDMKRGNSNSSITSNGTSKDGKKSPTKLTDKDLLLSSPCTSMGGINTNIDLSQYTVDITQNYDSPEYKRKLWDCLFWTAGIEGIDTLLLRFLVARKGKVQDALKMLINALTWRVNYDIRGLCRKGERVVDPTEFSSGKVYFYKFDKEGRIITYIHVSKHIKDIKPQIETEKMTILSMETIRLIMNKSNPTACMIFDMSGFSMQNMDYGFVRFLLNCFQNYYPEMLGIALIVGAPWIFYGCWNIVKQLLDPVVANKVQFIKDINTLKNFIDEDQMPSCFGGKSGFDFKYIPYEEKDDIPLEDTEEVKRTTEEWNKAKDNYIKEIYKMYKDKLPNVDIKDMLYNSEEKEEEKKEEKKDGDTEKSEFFDTNSQGEDSHPSDTENKEPTTNNEENNKDNDPCVAIRETEEQLYNAFVAMDKCTRSHNFYHRIGFTHY